MLDGGESMEWGGCVLLGATSPGSCLFVGAVVVFGVPVVGVGELFSFLLESV